MRCSVSIMSGAPAVDGTRDDAMGSMLKREQKNTITKASSFAL